MGDMERPSLASGYTLVLLMVCLIPTSLAACSYPSDLRGIWYTSHETNAELSWQAGNVSSFEYATTGDTYSGLTYECFINEGSFYVSKTTDTIDIFGADFYVYTCWVFSKISSDKYLYRLSVSQDSRVVNARVKVFPSTTTITQASEICDDTDYENNQYSILLRNGTAASQKTTCPSPLLATGRYTITDDGGTTYCDDNSWLDGCTDKSTLTANYTVCSTNLFYSSEGVMYCMYSTGFGQSGVYYTTLWNDDASPDQSSTYYFTCAVSDIRSDGVHISYYPGDCLNTTYQNATYISESTGFTVVMQTNTTCVSSSSESNLALILGIVFGLLFLIVLIVILAYVYYVKVYLAKKKRTSRAGSKVVPDTLPNTSMSQGDKNYRMMFTPAPPRSAVPGGRHHDYRENGQFGSQASMHPTVSQLAFYRTPTPRITDSKVENSDQGAVNHPFSPELVGDGDKVQTINESKSEAEPSLAPQGKPQTQKEKRKENQSQKQPKQSAAVAKSDVTASAILSMSRPSTSTSPKKKSEEEQSQIEPDEGVVIQDTSTDLEELQVMSPQADKGRRETAVTDEPDITFIAPIAQSFEAFYQKQISQPPTGRSTPKSKPLSHDKEEDRSSSTGTSKVKHTTRVTTNPRRPKTFDGVKRQSSLSSPERTKDMDLDSVLDFDTKRLGEPDGAESGVVMDMEGSLPVFSDSGDLTPEPTRITPRGKINKIKKPKPTPRGMAL